MHLYDDIGDASSSLRGSTSSFRTNESIVYKYNFEYIAFKYCNCSMNYVIFTLAVAYKTSYYLESITFKYYLESIIFKYYLEFTTFKYYLEFITYKYYLEFIAYREY